MHASETSHIFFTFSVVWLILLRWQHLLAFIPSSFQSCYNLQNSYSRSRFSCLSVSLSHILNAFRRNSVNYIKQLKRSTEYAVYKSHTQSMLHSRFSQCLMCCIRYVLLCPFYRWGNHVSEIFSNSQKVREEIKCPNKDLDFLDDCSFSEGMTFPNETHSVTSKHFSTIFLNLCIFFFSATFL